MSNARDVSRIERENGLLFGLKWSFFGFAIALMFLAGCSALFDEGPPRYNAVSGPRRPPPLNAETMQPNPAMQQMAMGQMQQTQMGMGQMGMMVPTPSPSPMMHSPMGGYQPQAGSTPSPMAHSHMSAGMNGSMQSMGEVESESWWDGMFDWFGSDDDEMLYQPYPTAAAANPYGQPLQRQPLRAYQPQPQPMQAMQPQPSLTQMNMPKPSAYVPPVPTAHMKQPAMQMPQPMPMSPQRQMTPQRSANVASIESQIAELEREMAQSEMRSRQLGVQTPQPQVQAPQTQQPWLPNATGRSPYTAQQSQPVLQQPQPNFAQPAMNAVPKPVRLPPPPPRNAGLTSQQPPLMAPNMRPQMQSPAPMPPVVSTPPTNPMANAPVRMSQHESINVPLAPNMTGHSNTSSIPPSLIPPSSSHNKAGYLSESRYSTRY